MIDGDRPGIGRRIGQRALQVLGIFVILEPIWMLLPFAGFLYGSVLRIETLSRHPETAWLTHFVFPVLAIGWGGPALAVLGLLVFFVGAGQIYASKIRKTGLVTGGLYRFVRHPQYVALTLFGLGILLTWGRAIAYVGFFLMMFLYYWLAKNEEARCRRLFGDEYDEYARRTSFVLPGDRHLRGLSERLGLARWPALARVAAGLALTALLCFGSMAAIRGIKRAALEIPYLSATVELGAPPGDSGAEVEAGEAAGLPFVSRGRLAVVRGPFRSAAAPGFAEGVLLRLPESPALSPLLPREDGEAAVAFGIPFDAELGGGPPTGPQGPGMGDGRGPPPDPAGPDRVRLMVFRMALAPGATVADALADPGKRTLTGAFIAPVDLARPAGGEILAGELFRPGPMFPAESRWSALVEQVRGQRAGAASAGSAMVPGRAGPATLVMARAPILRTRIDPEFGDLLFDRLRGSTRFRERLTRMGAGGDVVPIAFPRPGPNWYREHHGQAQISFFVVLARKRSPDVPLESLFLPGSRDLVGAFLAEMDLGIEEPADPVTAIEVIGPGRDLEERFAFFLSGL